MRKKNAIFPYAEQRNAELFCAFKRIAEGAKNIFIPDILKAVVAQPCSRFWVSEERATIVVSAMLRGVSLPMGEEKGKMYKEILRRVLEMRERDRGSGRSLYYTVSSVVNSPSPSFYMSPGNASRLINKMRFGISR